MPAANTEPKGKAPARRAAKPKARAKRRPHFRESMSPQQVAEAIRRLPDDAGEPDCIRWVRKRAFASQEFVDATDVLFENILDSRNAKHFTHDQLRRFCRWVVRKAEKCTAAQQANNRPWASRHFRELRESLCLFPCYIRWTHPFQYTDIPRPERAENGKRVLDDGYDGGPDEMERTIAEYRLATRFSPEDMREFRDLWRGPWNASQRRRYSALYRRTGRAEIKRFMKSAHVRLDIVKAYTDLRPNTTDCSLPRWVIYQGAFPEGPLNKVTLEVVRVPE